MVDYCAKPTPDVSCKCTMSFRCRMEYIKTLLYPCKCSAYLYKQQMWREINKPNVVNMNKSIATVMNKRSNKCSSHLYVRVPSNYDFTYYSLIQSFTYTNIHLYKSDMVTRLIVNTQIWTNIGDHSQTSVCWTLTTISLVRKEVLLLFS